MLLSLLELGCCRKDPGLRAGGRLPPARPSGTQGATRTRPPAGTCAASLLCVLRRRGEGEGREREETGEARALPGRPDEAAA